MPSMGAGGLWTAVLSKANSGRAETKATGFGMPSFSVGVIPEHTAVGAYQALGQRWAFLLFGKRVSSRSRAAQGGKACFRGDGLSGWQHSIATVVVRENKELCWRRGVCSGAGEREGGRSAERGERVAGEINGGGEVQGPLTWNTTVTRIFNLSLF